MIVNPTTFKSGGEKSEYQVELSGANINVIINGTTYTSAQTITVPAGTWCDAKYLRTDSMNAGVSFNGEAPSFKPASSSNNYSIDYKFPVFRDCKIVMEKPSGFGNNDYIRITTF